MSNSGFLLTDAGLADASASSPSGPYLHIDHFSIGSGYNYTPTRGMTTLVGSVLYSGTPQSYTVVDGDTIDVLLIMDPSVGNFYFGEIGLYSNTNVLLAVCVFTELQEKVRALGTTAGNIWKIHARIKLAQAPAICMVTVVNAMSLLEVPSWESLAAPTNQLSGANAVIVHEQNVSADSVLCIREGEYEWATLGYGRVFNGNFSDSGAVCTFNTITHPGIADLYFEMPQTNSRYIARFDDGSIRRLIGQPNSTTLTMTPGLGNVQVGPFSIWEDSNTMNSGFPVASAYEYNILATDLNRYWATPTGAVLATNAGINQTVIPTLTTRPTPGQWGLISTALRKLMQLLSNVGTSGGIVYTEILDTDFMAKPNNPMSMGVATLTELYQKYRKSIIGLDALRNSINAAWLELVSVPSATRTRTLPFVNFVDCTVTSFHGTIQQRAGFANAGGAYVITSVSSTSNPFYTAWNTFFAQIGQVVIERASTAATTGFGTPTSKGSQNVSAAGELVYSAQMYAPALASTLYYRVYAAQPAGSDSFVYTVQLQIVGSVTYSYTTPGSMSHAMTIRRASPALINQPVHPVPTAVTAGTF